MAHPPDGAQTLPGKGFVCKHFSAPHLCQHTRAFNCAGKAGRSKCGARDRQCAQASSARIPSLPHYADRNAGETPTERQELSYCRIGQKSLLIYTNHPFNIKLPSTIKDDPWLQAKLLRADAR
jgi:hypothetical protein